MFKSEPTTRLIKEVADIPEIFREAFQSIMKEGEPWPELIHIPKARWGDEWANDKLVCDFEDRLAVIEKDEEIILSAVFPYKDINYIQNGRILLESWILVSGVLDGELADHMIMFNSADEKKFIPFIKSFRKKTNRIEEEEFNNDKEFEFLYPDNLKFFNYSNRSVIQGEKVLFTIYQDTIRNRFYKVLDNRIAPSHMLILCDKELIIITDVVSKGKEADAYSGVISYLSLAKIQDMSLSERAKNQYSLNITMAKGDVVSTAYEESKKEELEELIRDFKELAHK